VKILDKLNVSVPRIFRSRNRPAAGGVPPGLAVGPTPAGAQPATVPPRVALPPPLNLNLQELWNLPPLLVSRPNLPSAVVETATVTPRPPGPVVTALPTIVVTPPLPTIVVTPAPIVVAPPLQEADIAVDLPDLLPVVPIAVPPTPTVPVIATVPTAGTSLMDLPTETLQHVMAHLARSALTPGVDAEGVLDQQAARMGAESLTNTNKRLHAVLQPMMNIIRINEIIENATTSWQARALLQAPQGPAPMSRLSPGDQERLLPRLLHRMDEANTSNLDSFSTTIAVRDHIANLPPASQAVILQEGMRNPGTAMNPRLVVLLGDTTPGLAPVPGTVLALPPQLQTGPLRTVVDFVFGAATTPAQLGAQTRQNIADVVNRLPEGVGDDLKTRVANP
jgi:hypothetical protein